MFRAASLALAFLIAFAAPAFAGQPVGSAGWTNWDATVYGGPGKAYGELGEIAAESPIRIERCSGIWCEVLSEDADGWIHLADISFGGGPGSLLSGPRLDYPPGGAGVCFYTGAGYSGTEFCVPTGNVSRDASLLGHDNSISSIQLEDGAKLRVCRDRNFRSWCELITTSQEGLGDILDDSISSWQVY